MKGRWELLKWSWSLDNAQSREGVAHLHVCGIHYLAAHPQATLFESLGKVSGRNSLDLIV
jgi:hypothetical protein